MASTSSPVPERRNCLIFIGMPGSGKSTLGRKISLRTGYAWVDTDYLLQAWWGMPLQSIFDHLGFEGFITAESELVRSINLYRTVISTGGSVVYKAGAMEHLGDLGRIVYLRAGLKTIARRIENIGSRGLAVNHGYDLKDVFRERLPLYERYAEMTLDTDQMSVQDCVEAVSAWLEK